MLKSVLTSVPNTVLTSVLTSVPNTVLTSVLSSVLEKFFSMLSLGFNFLVKSYGSFICHCHCLTRYYFLELILLFLSVR